MIKAGFRLVYSREKAEAIYEADNELRGLPSGGTEMHALILENSEGNLWTLLLAQEFKDQLDAMSSEEQALHYDDFDQEGAPILRNEQYLIDNGFEDL